MALLGIDLGTNNCVLATIVQGKVVVVRNELAERLTPALAGFTSERRTLGDEALSEMKGNYKNTCRSLKNILGSKFNELPEFEKEESLCTIGEGPDGMAIFQVKYKDESHDFTPQIVIGALVAKLTEIGMKSIGREITQIVISYPDWYSMWHRAALLDAIQISGLRCLQVMRESSAISLDYGIYRNKDFPNAPTEIHTLFISIGHSSATAFVTSYSQKVMNCHKPVSNPTLGGRRLTTALVDAACEDFKKKHKIDPRESRKAVLTMEDHATKMKHVLSANQVATMYIECLYEDCDMNFDMSRTDFEALLAKEYTEELKILVQNAVIPIGLDFCQITTVEIAGGCVRVPFVQKAIEDVTSMTLSKTLNQDETVARGSILRAAQKSEFVRTMDYTIRRHYEHSINIEWKYNLNDIIPENVLTTADTGKSGCNFNCENSSGTCTAMIAGKEHCKCILRFVTDHDIYLNMLYADGPYIGHSVGNGIIKIPENFKGIKKEIRVYIQLDDNDIISITNAYIADTEDKEEIYTEQVPIINEPNNDENKNSNEDSNGEDNKEVEEKKTEQVQRTRTVTRPIRRPLEYVLNINGFLSNDVLNNLKQLQLDMHADDSAMKLKMERLNALETFIYTARPYLSGNTKNTSDYGEEHHVVVYSDKQTMSIVSIDVDDVENWIYNYSAENPDDCGQTASLQVIEEKWTLLNGHLNDASAKKNLRFNIKELCQVLILPAVYEMRDFLAKQVQAQQTQQLLQEAKDKAAQTNVNTDELDQKCQHIAQEAQIVNDSLLQQEARANSLMQECKDTPLGSNLPTSLQQIQEYKTEFESFRNKGSTLIADVNALRAQLEKIAYSTPETPVTTQTPTQEQAEEQGEQPPLS